MKLNFQTFTATVHDDSRVGLFIINKIGGGMSTDLWVETPEGVFSVGVEGLQPRPWGNTLDEAFELERKLFEERNLDIELSIEWIDVTHQYKAVNTPFGEPEKNYII